MNRGKHAYKSTGFAVALLLASITMMTNGCTPKREATDKPVITVSILPQKYFLEKLTGDQFSIRVMIPPGESPATYDPTSEQMVQLSRSAVYFLIGHIGFEKTWIKELEGDYPGTDFFDSSTGILFEHSDHDGHDHAHHGIDPHVWMSVENVKQIAINMTNFLAGKFPDKAAEYNSNLETFNKELNALNLEISAAFQELRHKEFIIYHPALTYFARDYGLVQVPIEQEGKEPSARYMKTLIDHAKTNGIKAVFVQKQFNQEEAKTIEKQIDGKLIIIDPLAENWMEQMRAIANELYTVLR